jgi:hypothetical protein
MKVPFRLALPVLGAATLAAGCSDAPTASGRTPSAESRYTHGASVTISGPDTIDTSGNYTYDALTHALVSPTYQWSIRTCPNAAVGSCTSGWTIWPTTTADYFTTYLAVDCSGDGQKVAQVRVTAKGWVSPEVSDTHVTALCNNHL